MSFASERDKAANIAHAMDGLNFTASANRAVPCFSETTVPPLVMAEVGRIFVPISTVEELAGNHGGASSDEPAERVWKDRGEKGKGRGKLDGAVDAISNIQRWFWFSLEIEGT